MVYLLRELTKLIASLPPQVFPLKESQRPLLVSMMNFSEEKEIEEEEEEKLNILIIKTPKMENQTTPPWRIRNKDNKK